MENTPQYWHNNASGFIATILITTLISSVFLYFYLFSYIFAWAPFQLLMLTVLTNTNFMINLSITMAVVNYPSLILSAIGTFIAEDDFGFGFVEMILIVIIISGTVGMISIWLFFPLAIKQILLISTIFGVANAVIISVIFLMLMFWHEVSNTTINNWYFRLFGKSFPIIDMGEIQLQELITWLNLNTKKWCICEKTNNIYVMNEAERISLKLTFYEKNSKLES